MAATINATTLQHLHSMMVAPPPHHHRPTWLLWNLKWILTIFLFVLPLALLVFGDLGICCFWCSKTSRPFSFSLLLAGGGCLDWQHLILKANTSISSQKNVRKQNKEQQRWPKRPASNDWHCFIATSSLVDILRNIIMTSERRQGIGDPVSLVVVLFFFLSATRSLQDRSLK